LTRPPLLPPGRLIDIGTHRLHLHCQGVGAPAVVFDAALGGSSLSWSLVQPEVARFTTACAYDRAGFGWSDAGPPPRTAARLAGELAALLERAGVTPPYVLVGHSFGGLTIRAFAARHPQLVAGLVFVDPAHPEEWRDPPDVERVRIARGARLCRHGAVAARFGLATVVAALAQVGALGAARRLAGAIGRGGLKREDEEVLAPVTKLPTAIRPVVRWMWTQPRFYEALGGQIESICVSAAEAPLDPDYGGLHLATISAVTATSTRRALQEALSRRSTRGRHIVAKRSGHWIPLDEPETVIRVVHETVEAIRREGTFQPR
jgi:pimeloyl-ACP methyl ester carboxylesterase